VPTVNARLLIENLLPRKSMLTVADLATVLSLSERAVRRHAEAWIDSGGQEGIPAFKICGHYRFQREELVEFFSGRNKFLVTADNADISD
jgi:transcriptional antiterminator